MKSIFNHTNRCFSALLSLAAVAACLSARATTEAVWTDVTSASASWTDTSKWQDGSGEPLGTYPAGDYAATLQPMVNSNSQTIAIGDNDYTVKSLSLKSLSGDARHTVDIHVPDRTGYAPAQKPVHLSIANPNGFSGYFSANEANAWIDADTPVAGIVPTFAHVSASQYLHANVTNDVEKAAFGELYGGGVLVKEGPGALSVRRGTGANNTIYLKDGSLELGDAAVDVEALLQTAVFRFDADAAATLFTEVRADGRTYVTNWLDANGGSVVAAAPTYAGMNPPYLATEKSPTGRTLVDFGDVKTYVTDLPTNCYLALNRKITTGREFFYAGKFRRRAHNPVFGNHGTWDCRPFETTDSGQEIYNSKGYNPEVYNGFHYLNGEKRAAGYALPVSDVGWGRMHVLSTAALAPVYYVNALCTDSGENVGTGQRTGGVILGEAILFDYELTSAERMAINRYLMAKWVDADDVNDVGTVLLAKSEGEIAVPANVEAKVGTVVTDGKTLVKSGAGTLTVQTVIPTNATIRIDGGSVRFAGVSAEITTNAPADGAVMWLDATVGPFTYDHDSCITNWYDRRQDGTHTWYARARKSGDDVRMATTNLPSVVTNPRGLKAVDFGVYNATEAKSTASYMLLESGNATSRRGWLAKTYFLVFACNKSSFDGPIFSSSHSQWARNYYTRYLSEKTTALGDMLASTWREDGVVVDPCARVYRTKADGSTILDCYWAGEWHVASVSADELLAIDGLCSSLGFETKKFGSLTIGEVLLYDRRLTADEHRKTEAYLMAKWLGRKHPDIQAQDGVAPTLTYGAAVTPTFDTDSDMTIPALNGGDGNLVKKGSGTVTVGGFSTANEPKSVSVSDGELVLNYTDESTSLLTPSWHFDALDANTLQCKSESTILTNWVSTGTCLYEMEANRSTGDSLVKANPTVENVEMRAGVTRPCVNFGPTSKIGTWGYQLDETAGFRIQEKGKQGTPYNMCWLLQEAYAIVADILNTKEAAKFQNIFCQDNRNEYRREDFYRGANGVLFADWNVTKSRCSGVRDGYIGLDGVTTNRDAVLPSGFHLVSVQPVVTNASIDRYCIDAMAVNADETAGGLKIAEYVAYKGQHTARQRTFIEQNLMHKWFGTAAAKWNHAIPSVTVAEGATLTLNGPDVAFAVSSLAGAGTVAADRITGVSSITLSTDPSDNAILPLTVDGELALAETGTVTITGDRIRLDADKILLLTADTLSDVDLTLWTVNFPAARSGYGFRLVREGNSLYLVVRKPGFMVIVY